MKKTTNNISDNQKKINKAMRYASKLKDVKYKCNTKQAGPTKDGPPFWITNTPPPDISKIKKGGICCVGFANLIRRYLGLEIPGMIPGKKTITNFIGGTGEWFLYLKSTKRLKKINHKKLYPKGTLLLQNYNPTDQGHVAIVYKENKDLLNSQIMHAQHTCGIKSVNVEKMINYTKFERFTHICLPKDWLLKN